MLHVFSGYETLTATPDLQKDWREYWGEEEVWKIEKERDRETDRQRQRERQRETHMGSGCKKST